MFSTRYRLHKEIYNHKTVKLIELMLGDSLIEADSHFNFKEISKGKHFEKLDDSIYPTILNSDNKDLSKSANILKRIENRDLYKQLWLGNFDDDSHVRDFIDDNHSNVSPDNIKFIHMKYNYCNGNESPLKNVKFKASPIQHFCNSNTVSFEEKTVLIYNISNTT